MSSYATGRCINLLCEKSNNTLTWCSGGNFFRHNLKQQSLFHSLIDKKCIWMRMTKCVTKVKQMMMMLLNEAMTMADVPSILTFNWTFEFLSCQLKQMGDTGQKC
ncbi:hypothetical protein T08_4532 [Trichinella sp. T8]|nr:hypothetical protein T08_4532 [Trichinella sp. T8]